MKIDILFGILITLLDKNFVTAKFLADKYSISTRTVYRYLSILDTCQVPIETKTGKNGGIRLLNSYTLKNSYFTEFEKELLLNLVKSANVEKELKESIISKITIMK